MAIRLEKSWLEKLQGEFESAYFLQLKQFLLEEKSKNQVIYPPSSQIFAALDTTPFEKVKVVIIGQDPYHGPGQANGLCFSVNEGISFPPSLVNIFREIQDDCGIPVPKQGNLKPWADQGVLLLNATLTVRKGEAGSHQKRGWELFTDRIIELLNQKREGLVFMLWGSYAKSKGKYIDRTKHLVLESGHPSPLSANKGHWFGNKHFSKCNSYLENHNLQPINWNLNP